MIADKTSQARLIALCALLMFMTCAGLLSLTLAFGGVLAHPAQNAISRTSQGTPAVRVEDPHTGVRLQIRPPVGGIQHLTLSPDGRRVLVYSAEYNYQFEAFHIYDLYAGRLSALSTPPRFPGDVFQRYNYHEYAPLWSPDSRRVLYRDPGGSGLSILDFDANETHYILAEFTSYDAEAWVDGGTQIRFRVGGTEHLVRADAASLREWVGAADVP